MKAALQKIRSEINGLRSFELEYPYGLYLGPDSLGSMRRCRACRDFFRNKTARACYCARCRFEIGCIRAEIDRMIQGSNDALFLWGAIEKRLTVQCNCSPDGWPTKTRPEPKSMADLHARISSATGIVERYWAHLSAHYREWFVGFYEDETAIADGAVPAGLPLFDGSGRFTALPSYRSMPWPKSRLTKNTNKAVVKGQFSRL